MGNGIPLPPLFLGRCRCRVIYNFRLRGYFTFSRQFGSAAARAKLFDRLAGISPATTGNPGHHLEITSARDASIARDDYRGGGANFRFTFLLAINVRLTSTLREREEGELKGEIKGCGASFFKFSLRTSMWSDEDERVQAADSPRDLIFDESFKNLILPNLKSYSKKKRMLKKDSNERRIYNSFIDN